MPKKNFAPRGTRLCGVFHAVLTALLLALFLIVGPALGAESRIVLRIYDWKTGEIYAQVPARVGGRLFFGWIHSLEKIPWNEYYHIDENYDLVLDSITFPAFGAGIPENKGRVCYVKDGLIYMEEIGQLFEELVWLNSHTATRDITLDGELVARGGSLPQHTRVRLVVEEIN
ncbi:MAG: DUF1850 domain-containing protein [Synergistaceae bacterium]|jgi:hypothetical protein|nr:DUF1850 domain-containing protein [Synergistaceae bacterium]